MGIIRGDAAAEPNVLTYAASPITTPLVDGSSLIANAGEKYSYVSAGSAQSLDHVIVNTAVVGSAQSLHVEHARINADFGVHHYGTAGTALRVSDHDPLRLTIRLASINADLAITKTDGQTSVNAGTNTVYTITASNAGPGNAPATVTDTFPAFCVSPSWICAGAGGGICAASGSGNISQSVSLPVGGSVTFSATCPINGTATGTLSNTSTVTAGVTDPNAGNNSATDTSTIIAVPVLSINSVTVVEGDSGSTNLKFTVTRSTTGTAFTVDYATAGGTAAAGSDYTTTTGTLNFTAGGAATQTIQVPITGDDQVEGSESFTLSLSNPTGTAQVGVGTGTGTITDNDAASIAINNVSVPEGNSSTTAFTFTATLTGAVQGGFTVPVSSTSGTASAGSDFTAIAAGASLTFDGTVAETKTVTVLVNGDTLLEANENFTVTLGTPSNSAVTVTAPSGTGTIQNDDTAAATSISVTGPARSRVNQPTRFAFALSVDVPGAGSPTGAVTLSSGATSCTVTVPTPAPNCNLMFTTLGSLQVSASFTSSDGNHLGSSSSGAGNASTFVYALADLSVTKSDGEATYQPGDLIVYTVQVRNAGPDAAAQIRIEDLVPTGLTSVQWSCDSSGGASCNPPSGSGNLDSMLASVPVGGLLNFSYFGTVTGTPATIVNTASLILPADTTIEDPALGNNSATEVNQIGPMFADGFEAALVDAAEGSVRLPTAALAAVLDGLARRVYLLDTEHGEVAQVYARLHQGAVEYALAVRGADGRWTLGPWRRYAADPTLSWNAQMVTGAWQVTSVELR